MTMNDIPKAAFVDVLRDGFMAALKCASETGQLALGQHLFDEAVERLYECATEGTTRHLEVMDEVVAEMGDHGHIIADMGIVTMHITQLCGKEGNALFEGGSMQNASGEFPTDETVESIGDDKMRALGKATVKVLRRHGMAKGLESEPMNAKGSLGSIFGELLDEVIQEEIDDKCADFRDSLSDMLTVGDIPKPWSAPSGEVRNDDLPPPQ